MGVTSSSVNGIIDALAERADRASLAARPVNWSKMFVGAAIMTALIAGSIGLYWWYGQSLVDTNEDPNVSLQRMQIERDHAVVAFTLVAAFLEALALIIMYLHDRQSAWLYAFKTNGRKGAGHAHH